MPEISIAVDVGVKGVTYTTSNSGVKAVLTKNGTWYGSVSRVMGLHTVSAKTGITLGSSTWFSKEELLPLWLYGLEELMFVAVDAT